MTIENTALIQYAATQTHITLAQLAGEDDAGKPDVKDIVLNGLPDEDRRESVFRLYKGMGPTYTVKTELTKTGKLIYVY